MHEDLELTEHQLKLAKKVYIAMRKAGKAGVHFWDNYGKLDCYNSKKIKRIYPPANRPFSKTDINIQEHTNITYYEDLKNFFAGNADDDLYAVPKL